MVIAPKPPARSHEAISVKLVLETVVIYAALVAAAIALGSGGAGPLWALLLPVLVALGFWLDRLYTVAHEGVHRKLFPAHPIINDVLATILLLPICAPFSVFRKIHFFHHGQNRRDPATAALDSFVLRRPPTPLGRLYYRAAWIFCVFCGGFFFHTLVSIVLFLFVPTAAAQRISPVFRGFRPIQRLRAVLELGGALLFHGLFYHLLGARAWVLGFFLPLVPFAFIFSVLLYIYHYRVSFGSDVRHNVRSLPQQRLFSWLLLNFNQHATHHNDPTIPWYRLPLEEHALPPALAGNNNVSSLWQAIAQLRHGPRLYAKVDGQLRQVDP